MRLSNTANPSDPLLVAYLGLAFTGVSNVAAVAAAVSESQLLPPSGAVMAASPIGVWVSLATAGDILVTSFATPLATSDGLGQSVYLGSPAGVSTIRHGTNATPQGTLIKRMSLPAAVGTQVLWPYELAVPHGQGLVIAAVTVNVAMIVSWNFVEVWG